MKELLQFDVCSSSSSFNEKGIMISANITLSKSWKRGKSLKNYLPPSCMKTGHTVDVMANV